MKIFYAFLEEAGEGCDYTIGCGKKLIEIKAIGLGEAKLQLEMLIGTEYNQSESSLESALLFECEPIKIDVDEVYKKFYEIEQEEKRKKQEESDKNELERLKKKYDE